MSPMMLFSPFGVLLLIAVIWLVGGRGSAKLADGAAALARLRRDFFDYEAKDILLSTDGKAALLAPASEDERLGVVFAMGDDFATRLLGAGDIAKLAQNGAQLKFHIHEYTGRTIVLEAANDDAATQWAERLKKLEA